MRPLPRLSIESDVNFFARQIVIALLAVIPFGAQADTGWFMHPFGELRSYHGDFLNVCSDEGRGPCRTVNHVLVAGDTFYGEARLALHSVGDGWALEIWDQDLPFDANTPFALSVDGHALDVDPNPWSDMTPDGVRVAQSLSIINLDAAAPIIDTMRRGFFLTVAHEAGEAVFSLRGLINAQNAIEDHLERVSE